MRLFVGISIDAGITAAAAALIDELRRRAARLAPGARITWIPEDRLHITVRFIGEAKEDRLDAIRHVLAPPIDLPPFAVTLAGAGVFPPRGAPRVLWAGIADGREALAGAERAITRRLASAEVPPEDRAYSPHLTLARVRDAAGLRTAPWLEGVGAAPLGTTRVDAITLFESRPSPNGPTYVPLQRIPLGGR